MILSALWLYAAVATALFARQCWRARRQMRLAKGFVASGVTTEVLEPYVQTEVDRRRKYRAQLIALLEDAEYALTEAKDAGRRLDCLGTAVHGIRGALRNVCMEDGVPFVGDECGHSRHENVCVRHVGHVGFHSDDDACWNDDGSDAIASAKEIS